MTAREKKRHQDEVLHGIMEVELNVCKHPITGEYFAWFQDSDMPTLDEAFCWPTIGEACEALVWQKVDYFVKARTEMSERYREKSAELRAKHQEERRALQEQFIDAADDAVPLTLHDLMEMSHKCVDSLDNMEVTEIVQEHDYEDAYEANYYHELFGVDLAPEWADQLELAEKIDREY